MRKRYLCNFFEIFLFMCERKNAGTFIKVLEKAYLLVETNCIYQRKEEKEQVVNISLSHVIVRRSPGD